MTAQSRWALEGFTGAFARWVDEDQPERLLQKQVLQWILHLGEDPYPPDSGPVGGDFDLTWRFAKLPVGSTTHSRVVCIYRIDPVNHALTCAVVNELNEPI